MAGLAGEVSSCLAETGEVLTSLCEGASAAGAVDAALGGLWATYSAIKVRAEDDQCSVAVLALAKSGKSTFINALVGEPILPSNNVPETARIVAVRHNPATPAPLLTYPAPDGQTMWIEGAAAIREHLRQLNAASRDGSQGMIAGEAQLDVSAALAALAGVPTAGGLGITILDTPGPNEAGEDQLRYKVERLMEGVDAAIYLMDWSKLKTNEETQVLQRLHELNPSLLRRLSRRLFFVVNKMDLTETQEGMGYDDTRNYVAQLITSQLNIPGFELQPEQVRLISARDALLARLVLRPDASKEDVEAFRRVAFGKKWRAITDAQIIRDAAVESLEESGLPALEATVGLFLSSHAAVLHHLSTLDDLERLLAQVLNLTSASAASLHQGVAALSGQVEALQARLTDTLERFEGVQGEVAELEGLVVDEVRERMARLRCRLSDYIGVVLTADAPPISAPHGRWPAVWSMAKAILRVGRSGSSNAQAGSLDGVEGEQELQMKLSELHSMVYLQIEAEVKAFWHNLEQATNQRQKQLFSAINTRMAELSQAIESEVAGVLHCPLEPVDLRLAPPTAEQFHANLQDLLQRGIQREARQEVESVTENHTVYVKRSRDTMCRRFEWWEPKLESRTEELQVTRTSCRADADAIKAYFLGLVDETISNSTAAVRVYVRAYLAGRLAEAREQLGGYAERYRATMQDALDTARLGEAERAKALQVAEEHSSTLGRLLEQVQELQAEAGEMLEGWDGEPAADEEVPPAAAPAASTVAALAQLGESLAADQSVSWFSAGGGSTALDVAAAYAAQASYTGHCPAAGAEVADEEEVAYVPLQDDSSGIQADEKAALEEGGATGNAAGSSSGDAAESDWSVLSADEECVDSSL